MNGVVVSSGAVEWGLNTRVIKLTVEDTVSMVAVEATGGVNGDSYKSASNWKTFGGNGVRKELSDRSSIGTFSNRDY